MSDKQVRREEVVAVYISLIRGINVGGHKIIKMAALRALYGSLNLTGAQTLLQSGNVVFESQIEDRLDLSRQIEQGIEKSFGFHAEVILRTAGEWAAVIRRNPFRKEAEIAPAKTAVVFLSGPPSSAAQESLENAHLGREKIHFAGQELYLHYPDGMGRSKLTNVFIEKHLGLSGTTRNWNTVIKLARMAEGFSTP